MWGEWSWEWTTEEQTGKDDEGDGAADQMEDVGNEGECVEFLSGLEKGDEGILGKDVHVARKRNAGGGWR